LSVDSAFVTVKIPYQSRDPRKGGGTPASLQIEG
jgi:hypothetical protein